ncbi:unnamed protein product, partial [Iphiclides podalirius]
MWERGGCHCGTPKRLADRAAAAIRDYAPFPHPGIMRVIAPDPPQPAHPRPFALLAFFSRDCTLRRKVERGAY